MRVIVRPYRPTDFGPVNDLWRRARIAAFPEFQATEDAYRCFMGSEIEVFVVGDCFLLKEEQDPHHNLDYRNTFAPD